MIGAVRKLGSSHGQCASSAWPVGSGQRAVGRERKQKQRNRRLHYTTHAKMR